MAGIGEMLSNEANQIGHKSIVIQKRDLDPFGFGDHYGNTVYVDALDKYVQLLFESSRKSDVVIIHDWIEFLDEIECENIYVYFHGSKLRTLPQEQIDEVVRKVKGIILSTSDLKQFCPDGFVLPQPVDLELFYNQNIDRDIDQLTINRKYQQDIIEPIIRERYPDCKYMVRSTSTPIPYNKMPEYLNRCKVYIDWKFDYSKPIPKTVNIPSTTGLQALACGCTVVNCNAVRLSKSLLTRHDSKNVSKEFLKHIGANC